MLETQNYADKLYINNLKKLYPNITEKELDEMFNDFKVDMAKQVAYSRVGGDISIRNLAGMFRYIPFN